MWYIERDGGVEPATPEQFAQAYPEGRARVVAKTNLEGGVEVSTVFLGLDHAFGGGPPVLYETMIFGGPLNEYQCRYHTREEAWKGHQRVVQMAVNPQEDAEE